MASFAVRNVWQPRSTLGKRPLPPLLVRQYTCKYVGLPRLLLTLHDVAYSAPHVRIANCWTQSQRPRQAVRRLRNRGLDGTEISSHA